MIRFFLPLILFFSALASQANIYSDPDSLLKNRLYFELRNELNDPKYKSLPVERRLYYYAYIHNFFHDLTASNSEIQQLMDRYKKSFTRGQLADLLAKKIDNHVKLYEYKKAHETTRTLIKDYGSILTAGQLKDLKNSDIIWKGLEKTAPQTVNIQDNTVINYTRDLAGLINIPVRFGDSTFNFVFDTGANISVLTESYARKANIKPLNSYFNVRAITGLETRANLGVAKEFSIGNIIVRNAVFMIFPDSALSIGGGVYKIKGIIGFPIIEQLQEVRISKNNTITVPASPVDRPVRNFGLDELMPVINVEVNGVALPFTFDTGAQETLLNVIYYKRYKALVDSTAKPFDMKYGGAGGVVTAKAYRLPLTVFSLGKDTVQRPDLALRTVVSGSKDRYYYGNLGQDVMNQFREMIINFRYMYVDFVK